jgi:hypothetical protein
VVNRVVEDVLEGRAVLLLGLDRPRPEAAAEDVILSAMALVERPGVLPVEVAHPLGQVRERCLDDEVVVVAEETAGVQVPAVPPANAFQDPDEDRPVGIVEEDRRPAVPFRADVVVRAGLGVSKRSSHRATVAASGERKRPRASFDTLLLRGRHVPGT